MAERTVKVTIADFDEVKAALQHAADKIKLAEQQRDLLAAAITEHERGRAIEAAPWSRDGLLYQRCREVTRRAPVVTRRLRTHQQLMQDAIDKGLVEWVTTYGGSSYPILTDAGERWLREHKEATDGAVD